MPKLPISVTLEAENLLWLRARTTGTKRRSLSDLLDEIVTAARVAAHGDSIRSVVGTVDLPLDDPELERAKASIRAEFEASLARPILIHENTATYRAGRGGRTRRPQGSRGK
ncbi:MAG TPA: hypothetical protein VGQ37_02715 [Vicinamibacterales bacterium]|jgi:hypothetical protein|nr:hypothetical protein [Vicinamibacterales bacterium]